MTSATIQERAKRDSLAGLRKDNTPKRQGEVWQGPSGRWFTLSDQNHVVPAKNPNEQQNATQDGTSDLSATNHDRDEHGRPKVDDSTIKAEAERISQQEFPYLRQEYLRRQGTFDGDKLKSVCLDTDQWRDLFPGYQGTNAALFQSAAGEANYQLYSELLKEMKGSGNNTVMVLSGGGGSGKGTALGQFFDAADYPLRYDQVGADPRKVEQDLDLAIKEGFDAQYTFVDREPREAWRGVVSRALQARQQGQPARTVPIRIAVKANISARKTAIDLLKRRTDLPANVIDNNQGLGKARLIEDRQEAVKYLEAQNHDEEALLKELTDETVGLYESGKIPADIAEGLVGREAIHARRLQSRPDKAASWPGRDAHGRPTGAPEGTHRQGRSQAGTDAGSHGRNGTAKSRAESLFATEPGTSPTRDEHGRLILRVKDDAPKKPGEVWQGPSGRWFTLNDENHVVPAKNPNAQQSAPANPAGQAPSQALATFAGAEEELNQQANQKPSDLPFAIPVIDPEKVKITSSEYQATAFDDKGASLAYGMLITGDHDGTSVFSWDVVDKKDKVLATGEWTADKSEAVAAVEAELKKQTAAANKPEPAKEEAGGVAGKVVDADGETKATISIQSSTVNGQTVHRWEVHDHEGTLRLNGEWSVSMPDVLSQAQEKLHQLMAKQKEIDKTNAKKKEQEENGEWDGSIDESEVEYEDRDYLADYTTYQAYDESEKFSVYLEHGTYNPFPDREDSEPIDVYRWVAEDESGNELETGSWTNDRSEAKSDGRSYAEENDEPEPEPPDDDISYSGSDYDDEGDTPDKTEHWTEEEMSAAVFRMPAKPSIAAVFRDFEDHLDSLSSEQKSAIRFYTGSDYKQFNDKLKSCPPEFNCLDSRDRATFDAIQSAIREAGPLPDTVNALFRGVGPSRKASHDALVSAIEKARDTGADFEMGFIASSSLNAKYAWDTFSTDNGYGRFFFAIKAKTGLFVDPISENKGEDEVIQAAGTRYKIVSVREDIAIKNSDGYGSKRAKMLVFLEEV